NTIIHHHQLIHLSLHDTATSLIYTLSLHDALPIFHEKTLKKAKHADKYQKYGELLTANLHLVQRGDKQVTVIDYYDPEQKNITIDRKSTRLNSSHVSISYAVFCLKKKTK